MLPLVSSGAGGVVLEVEYRNGGQIVPTGEPGQFSLEDFVVTDRVRVTVVDIEGLGVPVPPKSYVYIDGTPMMPDLRVCLEPPLPQEVDWRFSVQYTRPDGQDYDYYPGPGQTDWRTLAASAPWNLSSELGEDSRGGRGEIVYRCNGLELQPPRVIHIRAHNPTEAAAEAYLRAKPYWFAYCIAKHESGRQAGRTYLQFNELGTLGPNPEHYKHCPNRSTAGPPWGWGMMQLTTFETTPGGGARGPLAHELWNWKANVDTGIAVLDVKEYEAEAYLRTIAGDGQGGYLMPPDIMVSGVQFAAGTDKTPDQLETIKRFNGGAFWFYNPQSGYSHVPLTYEENGEVRYDYTVLVMNQY